MRVGRNEITGESEIYLTPDEAEQMKEMVRGANLPLRQLFYDIIQKL